MAFANAAISDIIATTIQSRTGKIQSNVINNNGLLTYINKSGNVRTVSGGNVILEEISFAANGNAGSYSGYDLLPVAAQDVISAAEYGIKQYACPVTISGLEELQNAGKEQIIDLIAGRVRVAEESMENLIATDLYGDGTGNGGKVLTGLGAAVVVSPTNTYGGIDSNTWSVWRNKVVDTSGITSSTIQGSWNSLWASMVLGRRVPNVIVPDNNTWAMYLNSLQAQQRFSSADSAGAGFSTLKYMSADVILDGGNNASATHVPANTAYFLNTRSLKWRPMAGRNFVSLSPKSRVAVNQDAEVQILAFAGNLTCSARREQGIWDNN